MPSSAMSSGLEPVLCAPRPRRVQQVHPCSADLILGAPPFPRNANSKGRTTTRAAAEDEDCCWAAFGGSPPARADNPLVHDPRFLRNQRHPAPLELGSPNHRRPTYSSGGDGSGFASSSFAPAVRIQGFDVAACRSCHGNGGGRVLSARA